MSTGAQSVEFTSQSLYEVNCARYSKAHAPGNPHCGLLWSLQQVQRSEHVLSLFVKSLRAHRASVMPDERLRVKNTCVATTVRRDTLTAPGIGSSTLQATRGQALTAQVS